MNRGLYQMVLDNHLANIQILKNQRHLLQQHIDTPRDLQPTEDLIVETDDILEIMTGDVNGSPDTET